VLRALVLAAYDHMRGEERVFVSVALDTRERIAAALDGLLAAPTDIHAYVTMPSGEWAGAALDDRPLHFETALV
jgi:hypothetical protein